MSHPPQHLVPEFCSKPDPCLAHLGEFGCPKRHWSSCGKMGSRAGLEPTPDKGDDHRETRLKNGATPWRNWAEALWADVASCFHFRQAQTGQSFTSDQQQAAKWAAIKLQRMQKVLAVQSQAGTANITSESSSTPWDISAPAGNLQHPSTVKERGRNAGTGLWGHFSALVNMKRSNHSSADCLDADSAEILSPGGLLIG